MLKEYTQYNYTITLVSDYFSATTRVTLDLDDNTGNLSDEARDRAITEAYEIMENELGKTTNWKDAEVVLNLDGEDIDL